MRGQLTTEQRLKQANSRLSNENATLRERIKDLERQNKEKDQALEDLLIRVSELEEMVFGKKKKERAGIEIHDVPNYAIDNAQTERKSESYRRSVPPSKEITHKKKYTINNCGNCTKELTQKKQSIRYVEDIHLGILHIKEGWHRYLKTILQQQIEKGFCTKCRIWHSAIPINTQEVTIGIEVRLFINYAVYILRLSYGQVIDTLWDLYRLSIASGEITNVLDLTALLLKAEYARLKKRILKSKSLHLDEAKWQTANQKNYVWVTSSGDTEECLFLTGKNRGKGNVEKLLKEYKGVRVTDCYAAYKNLPGTHQVCWVHILRKARDLSTNSNLSEEKREFSKEVYRDLAIVYQEVKSIIENDSGVEEKKKLIPSLKAKIENSAYKIEQNPLQIKKLTNLKDLLLEYEDQLFTCIKHEGVEPNNNKAERKLRHLVLKRKNSFGTKTEKGNEIFTINASVLLSLWWEERDEFFTKFKELMINKKSNNEIKDG